MTIPVLTTDRLLLRAPNAADFPAYAAFYASQRSIWEDGLGRDWTNAVRFDLPDLDVFRVDALADPPV